MDDARLERLARAGLENEPELSGLDIRVRVENGIVWLEGRVPEWSQVVAAGHNAGALPDVRGVVNDISCDEYPRAGYTPPDEPTPNQRKVIADEDVVIIGGGIVGCSIARELSRYALRIVLIEKESDVACGTSKANNGMIHPGIDPDPGTLKAVLNVKGNALYGPAARELGFPFRRTGLHWVIFDEALLQLKELIFARAEANEIPGVEFIERDEFLRREPNVTPEVLGAFYFPTHGVTSPYLATVAYAENAAGNGVRFMLGTRAVGIHVESGRIAGVATDRGTIRCRYVVNAAGLFADEVAAMAGPREFTIHPRLGELVIFDSRHGDCVRSSLGIFALHQDPHSKGGGVSVTVDGNMEWGPTAVEVPFKEERPTSARGIQTVLAKFQPLLPGFAAKENIIAAFAGLRAATYTEDFHIRPSDHVYGLFNVGGIQSPGLAAAPAIAGMVVQQMAACGVLLRENPGFDPIRPSPLRWADLSPGEKRSRIREDPSFGRVVCRCEGVTEGDIVAAMHRPVPALTVDAVKRRTRAGMGRCQGAYCLPRVGALIARELGISIAAVTKDGPGSELFLGCPGRSRLAEGEDDHAAS